MSEVTAGRPQHEVSGWAIGWTSFAGFMMILIGTFHVFIGIAGIAHNAVFVTAPGYWLRLDLTAWGWIQLFLGVIVAIAGFSVFTGAMWARVTGVIIALLSMLANFIFLPYYPLWSILIIAIDIAVIWALTAHGRDITMTEGGGGY